MNIKVVAPLGLAVKGGQEAAGWKGRFTRSLQGGRGRKHEELVTV